MYLWMILALIFAFLEVVAVSKNLQQLEHVAKPAVMICLFLWLYTTTGLQGNAFWFGLGIVFSLLGDVLLMSYLERMFLYGLVAFLFTHVFYIAAMRARGANNLVILVILYGTIISLMFYAAMATIYNPAWKTSAAFFVSAGAFLFCASDAILAWNRFVAPVKNGRVWNITLYYLGQIGLVAGAISQFA